MKLPHNMCSDQSKAFATIASTISILNLSEMSHSSLTALQILELLQSNVREYMQSSEAMIHKVTFNDPASTEEKQREALITALKFLVHKLEERKSL